MSQKIREEMLPRLRQRYMQRGRAGRSVMIDELCEQFGYSRKHAIKLLGGKTGWGGGLGVRRGRPPIYGKEVVAVLFAIWKAGEQPCGKRLVEMVPLWLPYYEAEHGHLSRKVRKAIKAISAAQIDRLLAPRKARAGGKGRCGTKPGSLIKTQIPIRTDHWDVTSPGYLEADTVAHCGTSMEGSFIWSVTYTDIYSGWTSLRAVWNKGAAGVVEATRDVEGRLPFEILGFDCDNGSEFLNWHLVSYFTERPKAVGFTRSRPYHKNDNGHVEQKNWTHVRQLLGYDRLEEPELLEHINIIYREYWEPLHNFFSTSAKLVSKNRHGAKMVRRHDTPRTPCDRLLESPELSARTKADLRAQRKALNPFELNRKLEGALRRVLLRPLRSSRPTGSLHSGTEEAKTQHNTVS